MCFMPVWMGLNEQIVLFIYNFLSKHTEQLKGKKIKYFW